VWSMKRGKYNGSGAEAALQAAFLGMMAGSLFASWTLVTGLFLWVLAGMIAALRTEARRARTPVPIVWRVAAGGVAATFLFVAAALAAQDFFWANLQDAVADKDFRAAETAYESAVTLAAGMPGYELWGSREFATLARTLGKSPDAALAWRKA